MSPVMTSLTWGLVLLALSLPVVMVPGKAHAFFMRMYRHVWLARVLTVVDMLWVGWLLLTTFWGGFEPYKQYTYVFVPVAILLICRYVDELLMPRALGGLFLLIPAPVLDAFRWQDSSFRYVLIVFCYVLVIAGFALIMNPFVYRKTLEWMKTPMSRFRASGGVLSALGVLLLSLALWVF
jgi:uncharacterized protein YjeT (DUF2065 family)